MPRILPLGERLVSLGCGSGQTPEFYLMVSMREEQFMSNISRAAEISPDNRP